MNGRICLVLTGLVVFATQATAHAQPEVAPRGGDKSVFSYYYDGKLVSLSPSKSIVAISEKGVGAKAFADERKLRRDSLSDLAPLKERKLGLYRLPASNEKADATVKPAAVMRQFREGDGGETQPVFEQGQALLIPSDEIIVRFKEDTDLVAANRRLTPHKQRQGISGVRKHRRNTFIVTITRPSDGRVFEVSRFFSTMDGVDFAEPNHTVVFLPTPNLPRPTFDAIRERQKNANEDSGTAGQEKAPSSAAKSPKRLEHSDSRPSASATRPTVFCWKTLIQEDFEAENLPPNWTIGAEPGTTDAHWCVTDYRSHSGSRCVYATGGGSEGVAPPGDYPNDCLNWLQTPAFDLACFDEVYVELWFYAKLERWNPYVWLPPAAGWVLVHDGTEADGLGFLAVPNFGDLTADPTTDRGWRRALFRLEPHMRRDGMKVWFAFVCGHGDNAEGLYIDQVRIVGGNEVHCPYPWPRGLDPYFSRQYELRNTGQIAGLGNDHNDLHAPEAWRQVRVSEDVVVAVIDSGVDLTHPDLNLVTGYDWDGGPGGHERGRHGTACAGNAGAIGFNSLGVVGTAPGVKIMPIYMGYALSHVAAAIDVAVENGADILTNSWGWVGAPSADIRAAIEDALDANRVVLFAAGNGPDRPPWTYDVAFPGNLTASTDVICVGASSPTDEHKGAASSDGSFYWGSSYVADGPDVVAPSPWSYTTDVQGSGGYNSGSLIDPADPVSADYTPTFGGTSSSTPKVAGVVALLLSVNPNLTPGQVKMILRETADDIHTLGEDDFTGAGRVNACRAVQRARPDTCCLHHCGWRLLPWMKRIRARNRRR